MNNVRRIFRDDLKHIVTNFFALVIAVGVLFLPALYAWFNIYSNWDPYGNTENLKLAAISLDKGYTDKNGDSYNLGDDIMQTVYASTAVDWQFVETADDAINGVYDGTYYAAIIIEEDFSERMFNVFNNPDDAPAILMYENQKKNPVATKISDTVVESIQTKANGVIIEKITARVFDAVNEAYDAVAAEGGGENVFERLDSLKAELSQYELAISQIILSNESLNKSLETASNDVNTIASYSKDSSESLADASEKLDDTKDSINDYTSKVDKVMGDILSCLDKMQLDLQNGMVSDSTEDMINSLNACADDAEKLIKSLKAYESAVSVNVEDDVKEAKADYSAAKKEITKAAKEATGIATDLSKALTEVSGAAAGKTVETAEAVEALMNTDEYKALMEYIEKHTAKPYAVTTSLIDDLKDLPSEITNEISDLPGTEELELFMALINTDEFKNLQKTIKNHGESTPDDLKDLNDAIVKAAEFAETEHLTETKKIAKKIESGNYAGHETVETLGDVITAAENVKDYLSTQDYIGTKPDNTADLDNSYLVEKCERTNESIKDMRDTLTGSVFPMVNNSMQSLTSIVEDASALMLSVSDTMTGMSEVFGNINNAVSASEVSLEKTRDSLGELCDALNKVTETLAGLTEDENVKLIVDTMTGNPAQYAEFFADPVAIEDESIFPVANYGSAVAPFYTTLAIWVGALILTAVIKVNPNKKKYKSATDSELFFGRYGIYFLLSQLQALVIALGDLLLLKVQCVEPVWFWFAASVTATAYSMLIYALVVTFGDIGKAAVVVIVVLQIAGSSGTYPIELLPGFFKSIYIFFPFPYSINAMRECTGGMYEGHYMAYLAELCMFILVGLFIGLVVRIPFKHLNHYVEERMEDTGVL